VIQGHSKAELKELLDANAGAESRDPRMDLSKTQLIESVLAGGGETGARMRALDWSTTALGPLEQWPQALRICVRIVLGSGYPMCIAWGPDYVLLYNDAFRPPMGAKHPWALGRGSREVLSEAWDFFGPVYDRVMTGGQEVSFLTDQLIVVNRNNYLEECYFAWSLSPIPDDNGHVGGLLSVLLETTERVLEDRRRHVLRDLASRTAGARNEEEVWRVSAETLGQNRLSVPFAFLYEYRPSEHQAYLAGASVETDEALHPPVIDCHSENLWRFDPALTRDGVVVELGNRASRVSVANWPAPPKEASVVPIRLGEHSEALGFLVVGIHPGRAFDDAYRQFVHRIAEPITIGLASARAYEQERQRAEALAELDRAKTTFFSNVSHEFRTPLTLMLGPLEEVLPEAGERLGPERHEQLLTVRRNALRLLKLVNTLLDFSRIEAGRVQAVYQPTDLATLTSEIASVFRSAMENAGLRFSVECQPIAERVYVDRDMWEKVVFNLLSNAFKFTLEGEVAVTLKPVDGVVELQVRDTGVGIPEEQRERVFERFHRIEGIHARTHEGTGIGLALVQELVKLHGGSVRVESALGQGSTFRVTIPSGKEHLPAERIQAAQSFASTKIRAEAYVEEAQQWSGDESGASVDVAMLRKPPLLTSSPEPNPAAKRELIILADDNADMRRYLMHLLGERYEVHAVADGRQALEATRQLRPALVLADVMMPRLDGFGLLRAIRDDLALASTPVILLSARAGEESRVEGLQADADDYLVKPFAARELLARVATHVKMANLRRETAEREERLRSEAELEREKLRASEERLVETSRLYRELQKREAKIRRLVEANVVGIVVGDLEGRIVEANGAFLRMVEYDREDLASGRLRWTDLTPAECRDRDERAIVELKANGVFQPYEKEYFRKDGSRVPILQGGALFEDSGNEGVAFILDLSEQKRTEEALRRSESYLAQAQRLARMGSWAWQAPGRNALYLSTEWYRLFGFDPKDGMPSWEQRLQRIHPEDRARVQATTDRAIAEKSDYEVEFRIVAPHMPIRFIHSVGQPAMSPSGELLQFVGVIMDVTDSRLAEEERQRLHQLEADLAHMNRISMLGELVASLSHELKQPITAAITNAKTCLRWLARDEPDLQEAREAVTRVVQDGDRAAEVISRLRSLYRKGAPAERELVDVNELIREMLALLGNEAKRTGISLRTTLAAELPKVTADRVQLQQVFMNLMLNGIESMKETSGELAITSQLMGDGELLISVSDTGVGLPAEKADRIFDAFFTTKPQGSGMGLAISRSIVESHRGRLWATPNSGRGTTFHFTLPTAMAVSTSPAA
jgi:PAS domain S-box-containing protein